MHQTVPSFSEQYKYFAHGTLERVVVGLVSADVDLTIDEIDDLFRDTLTMNPELLLPVTAHYGQRVLSSPLPIDEQPASVVKRLNDYTFVAKERAFPELYVLWQALLSFQREDFAANEVTGELVRDAEDLEGADAENFYRMLFALSNPATYMKEVTQAGRRLADKISLLVERYPQLAKGVAEADRRTEGSRESGAVPFIGGTVSARTGAVRSADLYLADALQQQGVGWTRIAAMTGQLGQGESRVRPVEADPLPEREYRLFGACDESCADVDLVLFVDGDEVDGDIGLGDLPDVRYGGVWSNELSVEVGMINCAALTCGYAIAVLERELN